MATESTTATTIPVTRHIPTLEELRAKLCMTRNVEAMDAIAIMILIESRLSLLDSCTDAIISYLPSPEGSETRDYMRAYFYFCAEQGDGIVYNCHDVETSDALAFPINCEGCAPIYYEIRLLDEACSIAQTMSKAFELITRVGDHSSVINWFTDIKRDLSAKHIDDAKTHIRIVRAVASCIDHFIAKVDSDESDGSDIRGYEHHIYALFSMYWQIRPLTTKQIKADAQLTVIGMPPNKWVRTYVLATDPTNSRMHEFAEFIRDKHLINLEHYNETIATYQRHYTELINIIGRPRGRPRKE